MAASYRAILRGAPGEDGAVSVYLVFTAKRIPSYLSMGFAVRPKHWNQKADLITPNWVRSGNPARATYNAAISSKLRLAAAWLEQRPDIASREWRDLVKAGTAPAPPAEARPQLDFLAYFEREVQRRAAFGNPRSAGKLGGILDKLKAYRGWRNPKLKRNRLKRMEDGAERSKLLTGWVPLGATGAPPKPLPFSELTPSFIRDYRLWLENVVGNSGQTPAKELSFLKTIVLLAIDDNLLEFHRNPFKRMKLGEGTSTKTKERLTEEEVAALETVDLPADKWHQVTRDAWLLQYFLFGARVADVVLLRWRSVTDVQVRFQEQKTGKWKTVGRHERLNRVLARYAGRRSPDDFVLPLLDAQRPYAECPEGWNINDLQRHHELRPCYAALLKKLASVNSQLNHYLKRVAAAAGIDKHLTTHVARHSFAAMARRQGVSSFDLRDMLNHQSVEQTEAYAGTLEREELAKRAPALYQRVD